MTWSIIARDRDSGSLGIAVASRFFAVGSLVPWVRSGVGAVATQAMVNPTLGPAILDRLGNGEAVEAALTAAWGQDDGAAVRQIHVLDSHGNRAAHTGNDCIDWCGDMAATNISVAGNMLAGKSVLQACLEEYRDQAALPFPERLLRSLLAGDGAGGDKRGRQSAALKIHTAEVYPDWDLRVDDHPDAPNELARIFAVGQTTFAGYKEFIPTHLNPGGVTDRAKMAAVREKAGPQ
ncbi:MAG: DUF1028 domain-containing protein [Alphaproteobacteria bacterium]|nr:DUF1028 domain-containing protein [Alphaproteobacteria bacterium]